MPQCSASEAQAGNQREALPLLGLAFPTTKGGEKGSPSTLCTVSLEQCHSRRHECPPRGPASRAVYTHILCCVVGLFVVHSDGGSWVVSG